MTAVPPTLLTDLYGTTSPRRRATRLHDLADAHELTGQPARARLLRLIAETETLLDSPSHEVEDDEAWDIEAWWQLASTTDRNERAELLTLIWRDWAIGELGDAADVLLDIAATERAAAGSDTLPLEQQAPQPFHDAFDYEAGLADVYARSARLGVPAVAAEDDEVSLPPAAHKPSASRRSWIRRNAANISGILAAALTAAVAVALIAAPTTPAPLRIGAALGLVAAVISWTLWNVFGRRP